MTRFDKVSAKIQGLIPLPDNTSRIQNFTPAFPTARVTSNDSVKLDHQLSPNAKISGYYGSNATGAQFSTNLNGSEGLPGPLTVTRGTFTQSYAFRINYDHTLTPTVLFHLGAGMVNYPFNDNAPYIAYDHGAGLGQGTAFARVPGVNPFLKDLRLPLHRPAERPGAESRRLGGCTCRPVHRYRDLL